MDSFWSWTQRLAWLAAISHPWLSCFGIHPAGRERDGAAPLLGRRRHLLAERVAYLIMQGVPCQAIAEVGVAGYRRLSDS